MKLFPAHPSLWASLLVLWVSQSETEDNSLNVCQQKEYLDELRVQDSTGQDNTLDKTDVEETFNCLLYPTNTLNCSWSFGTLEKDTQLSVSVSVCDEDTAVQSLNQTSVERVGSMSLNVGKHEVSDVILHFNMSRHEEWKTYTYVYDMDMLEVLSPPQNISASIKDGGLDITWDAPHPRSNINPTRCFNYQLDMSSKEKPIIVTANKSFREPNADPSRTYKVRIRTIVGDTCHGSSEWSAWSPTVTVEQSVYKLNPVVIISISLGVPMILLAVLLLVRNQRVSQILFPPIPRPPPKYKHFLEKNDAFNFFHPAPPAKPEEEITEVQETEQNTGKSF
ncbi:interleukin-5 receptor subunit alpha-like [Stegastes partitus]|uniref:Interleukin-5 receptor subunit alpha-like n=1 Tax=Stegastes partitus TaxID=144197 RepID=A0A9Y4MQQ3_9TELE|nr:PREDICTED: interleukin-5 receptor subunit alpha-like [Stegastes partitus]XP_008303544.1 PREDICTED: interleukin-5 receptor subunit alpha-like [Stegastes partitus]